MTSFAPRRTAVKCLVVAIALALSAAVPAAASAATEPSTPSAPEAIAPPSLEGGATVATVVAATTARAHLGAAAGQRWPVATETFFSHHQQSLLALAESTFAGRTWVQVLLPLRPDGTTGWIPRNNVVLTHTPYWIHVELGARRVNVYRNGQRVHSMEAVVGKPSTPTPPGLAAVYEKNLEPEPRGFVGPWVLALTAQSEALKSFEGGEARVGIHGRDGESLLDPLGSARSHGCVRIADPNIRWMAAHVPVGTPVELSP